MTDDPRTTGLAPDHDEDAHARLSGRMVAAARDLQGQEDPATTYTMATRLALSNVAGCHAASLSIVRRGHVVENRAATEPAVAWADTLQTELSEGPCLQSIVEEATTYSPSLAYDRRWPTWGPLVVERTGMHSVLSFQLFTHADTIGALNLYSRDKDGFDTDERYDGLALAAHISIAIAAADSIDHLGQALSSRTIIGQATGMLVERFKVTPDVAFRVLARVSSTENLKVRDLAERLVRTGHLPSTDRSGHDPGADGPA